jgi:acetyltransferase-like isoleucine patch superfamily enzyme
MRLKDSSLFYKLAGVARYYVTKIYHYNGLTSEGISLFGPGLSFFLENGGTARIGNKMILSNHVLIQSNGELTIGNNLFVNAYSRIVCHSNISIGDNVTLASGVAILDHDHRFANHGSQRIADGYETAPVKIGSNVWIGDKVIVLKGVTIGNNVTVGAGSVVTRDIPDNSVAVGVPARVISCS